MSKNPKPKPEELRFVYELIAKGYNEKDVLDEYVSLYEAGTLMHPWRKDSRFVRERMKELSAAEEVLRERVKKRTDPVISKQRVKHFEELAETAQHIMRDISGVDVQSQDKADESLYGVVWGDGNGDDMTRKELASELGSRIEDACYSLGVSRVGDLNAHLSAELPETVAATSIAQVVEDNPFDVVQELLVLCRRRTFRGVCDVCRVWQ